MIIQGLGALREFDKPTFEVNPKGIKQWIDEAKGRCTMKDKCKSCDSEHIGVASKDNGYYTMTSTYCMSCGSLSVSRMSKDDEAMTTEEKVLRDMIISNCLEDEDYNKLRPILVKSFDFHIRLLNYALSDFWRELRKAFRW